MQVYRAVQLPQVLCAIQERLEIFLLHEHWPTEPKVIGISIINHSNIARQMYIYPVMSSLRNIIYIYIYIYIYPVMSSLRNTLLLKMQKVQKKDFYFNSSLKR